MDLEQEIALRRNAVFGLLRFRAKHVYRVLVPPWAQRALEACALISAVLVGLLWAYVHFVYVLGPVDCLAHVTERPLPPGTILRVEVYSNSSLLWGARQRMLLEKDATIEHSNVSSCGFTGAVFEDVAAGQHVPHAEEQQSLLDVLGPYTVQMLSSDYTLLEFTQEPGYLSLTTPTRRRLNVTVSTWYVDPGENPCFGGPVGRWLCRHLLGYHMMVIGSLRHLLPPGQDQGFVKDVLAGALYYYQLQWMGRWLYALGLLPVVVFTLASSIVLRQIYYHFFKFITHFHHLVHNGVPMPIHVGAQIPFLLIIYAAVGLLIVMSEALGDDGLFSLAMVGTVWEADHFHVLLSRHKLSLRCFPWFFYLYHLLPYSYFIRFNGQFWVLPFLFHWFLLQHIMMYFWHRYELPSVQHLQLLVHHPLEQVQPVQQDPEPVQQDPEPVQQDPEPVQQDPEPVQQDPEPVQQDPVPVQQEPGALGRETAHECGVAADVRQRQRHTSPDGTNS